ncbi:hypothetical protein J2D73_10715 [Acetobacter sacchari]|uniref:Pesticin C-terminal domain-containing protein n=1 Tax=Acetobacter sacchari TaxID=2661687 RepID=A0ABS3LWI8_9PROT|nr:pesticin C-terminus-like muramidase [Acetobacter sacchari]MBO1360258.1 hypothetical protein [Acetobacter sacchari]
MIGGKVPGEDGLVMGDAIAKRPKVIQLLMSLLPTEVSVGKRFNELPLEMKTVIDDLHYHYGDLSTATPRFWGDVTSGNWSQAINELRNFDDDFPTRRNAEADAIQNDINYGFLK